MIFRGAGKRKIFFILYFGILFGLMGVSRAIAHEVIIDLSSSGDLSNIFSIEVLDVAAMNRQTYSVYIYHTHTYEAYDMRDGNQYKETEKWRTADNMYNVVRIGAELKSALENAGITVMHDTYAYEMPRLTTAYSRSLESLEKAVLKEYDLYIDLHRDSYSVNNGPNVIEKDNMQLGRFLFLIGQGTGTDFDEKPDWEKNAHVAGIISDALNEQAPGISRGVKLKSGRYNQHITSPVILIEAGNNKNTLTEMLGTIPYLANAICTYLDTLK